MCGLFTHVGLQAQRTASSGKRPAPLEEVAERQVRAATVSYVAAAGAPLLAWPSLAGGDAIDDTSVHFLLEMALKTPEEVERMRRAERRRLAREEEEKELEEKREKEGQKAEVEETIARLAAEFWREHSQASSSTQRRWQAQMPGFLVPALVVDSGRGLCRAGIACISLRAVFHSVVCRPEMLGIMACLDQKDSCIPYLSSRPRCSAFWSVWTRRTVWVGFAADDTSRAVFLACLHAHDARHHGRYDSGGQLHRGVQKSWAFLEDDVICFRIRLFGSTVDTYLCQSIVAWCMVQTAENCGNSVVAVHRWSSNFLSCCRGRFP